MATSSTTVRFEHSGAVGLILIDSPPVNAINQDMRVGLADALAQAMAAPDIRAVLILSAGGTFMAGVDISEFDGAPGGPPLQQVQAAIEQAAKPVVVAMQGMALGGGLELAMACHYRLALDSAKLGLPEITLGIIPGAGGTQRLPRLIGARAALDMILSGAPITAQEGKAHGLIDEVVQGDLRAAGLAFCQNLIDSGAGPRPTREMQANADGFDAAGIADVMRTHSRALRGRTTQTLAIEAISAAMQSFDEGIAIEARLAAQSLTSRESQALRHMFFAERQAGKVKGEAKATAPAPIRDAAVIGAGTMGSGIAQAFADAGVTVTLIDSTEAGLAHGQDIVRSNYAASVKRGRISPAAAEERIQSVTGSLRLEDAATADVVVEAVFEDLELKQDVLSRLDAILPPDRLIASNTSTLSVTGLGRATAHPGRIAGLHFFSPAHIMKLVEVVRGGETSPDMLAKALQVAKILKKIAVVAGDGFGFIGNRMMLDGYFREAEQLLLEGASPSQVDGALERFGFAMGPQRVSDLGGTDVGTKARIQLYRRETRPDPYFVIADRLTTLGRLGQKSGSGFYRYEPGGRDALPDPEVTAVIEALAAERGIKRRDIGEDEIIERCILSLINVGAMVLDEAVAARAADIDVVWTSGYGFPRHLGGPMFHADTLGLAHVAERIRYYSEKLGSPYWRPSALIERLAADGSNFDQWDRERS